jgi:hypothetical protein
VELMATATISARVSGVVCFHSATVTKTPTEQVGITGDLTTRVGSRSSTTRSSDSYMAIAAFRRASTIDCPVSRLAGEDLFFRGWRTRWGGGGTPTKGRVARLWLAVRGGCPGGGGEGEIVLRLHLYACLHRGDTPVCRLSTSSGLIVVN